MCWKMQRRLRNFTKVSVAGCLGYDVLEKRSPSLYWMITVSVAGCLGYDVLDGLAKVNRRSTSVSVAGCLGYDVLALTIGFVMKTFSFSCWLFRL